MIAGWLVKIVVVIALLGFAAVEAGSPLWTRAQLDGVAHDAADEAARVLENGGKTPEARVAADETAAKHDAVVTEFDTTSEPGRLRVTVYRQAKSYLLHNFNPTRGWYDVSVEASSDTNRK